MTSTIGIPIKLLNEATVRESPPKKFLSHALTFAGPHCYPRTLDRPSVSRQTHRRYYTLFLNTALLTGRNEHMLTKSAAEDNMNVQLKDITVTARDGRVSHLDQVYIRGSHVRFFIVPDMLRNAPMFRQKDRKGRGVGLARGKATVSRARGQRGGAPRG
jgi:hypothetical protein